MTGISRSRFFRRPAVVALLLLAALAACDQSGSTPTNSAGDFGGDLAALGTEPFWRVNIRADQVTLSRLGEADSAGPNKGPTIDGGTATWSVAGVPLPFTLTLTKQDCSDGMSDRHYPFKAILGYDERSLSGCATTPAALASKPAP
jgi:uncharacterized membrane protein